MANIESLQFGATKSMLNNVERDVAGYVDDYYAFASSKVVLKKTWWWRSFSWNNLQVAPKDHPYIWRLDALPLYNGQR